MSWFNFKKSKVLQVSTGCLSHFTYVLFSGKQAAIIDPLRHSDPYIKLLTENNAKLNDIFLSHIHADFVSGHLPLSKKTGARIIMGPEAKVDFPFYQGKDNEHFALNDVNIKLLHTPGHTRESSCFLLQEDGKDVALFTGDTLFLGDAGRPDLGNAIGITPEELASKLFYSMQRLKKLPDDVVVLPTHGSGSPCGKNIQKGSSCLLGRQKLTNRALQIAKHDDFVKFATSDLDEPPKYFLHDVSMNKAAQVEDSDELLKKMKKPMTPAEVAKRIDDPKTIILDTRSNGDFLHGHIKNAVAVPLSAKYALYFGYVHNGEDIVIVADPGKEEESILRLTRIGIDNVVGYLDGGMAKWDGEVVKNTTVSPKNFADLSAKNSLNIIDVRAQAEYQKNHVEGAQLMPLTTFAQDLAKLDKSKTYHVYCASGIRSTIAQTIARRQGLKLVNILEGFNGIESTHAKLSNKPAN